MIRKTLVEKKIFIDIYHLPQYNFFRNAIRQLGPQKVDLGCVNRGKLINIIKHECPEFNLFVFGDYKNNRGPVSMGVKIILPRILQLINLFRIKKYSVIGTAHYQANIAARLLRIPNFSILDDPRTGVLQILKKVANEFYLPPFSEDFGIEKRFIALKEWAYLSSKYFFPSVDVLNEYNLTSKEYVFIREVSTNTSNYLSQEKDLILQLASHLNKNIKVVLSLEDKKLKNQYPKTWIILNEPVSDIHSLLYHSKLVISSGDSMAREGGMLGVPSIYLGNRDMPANRILIEKGILKKLDLKNTAIFIHDEINGRNTYINQETFRKQLEREWDDVSQLIIDLINKLEK